MVCFERWMNYWEGLNHQISQESEWRGKKESALLILIAIVRLWALTKKTFGYVSFPQVLHNKKLQFCHISHLPGLINLPELAESNCIWHYSLDVVMKFFKGHRLKGGVLVLVL